MANRLGKRELISWFIRQQGWGRLIGIAFWFLLHPRMVYRAAAKCVRMVFARAASFVGRREDHKENPLDLSQMPDIRTAQLYLRPCTMSDVVELAAVFPTGHLGPQFPDRSPVPSWWRQLCLVNDLTGNTSTWAIARRHDGKLVGCCGLGVYQIDGRQEVEMGYWIGEEYWGNGFASEAANAVQNVAFSELCLGRLISLIDPENHASIRIAEKNAMRHVTDSSFRGRNMSIYAIEMDAVFGFTWPLTETAEVAARESSIVAT